MKTMLFPAHTIVCAYKNANNIQTQRAAHNTNVAALGAARAVFRWPRSDTGYPIPPWKDGFCLMEIFNHGYLHNVDFISLYFARLAPAATRRRYGVSP